MDEEQNINDKNVYEVGFHLSPELAEESLSESVSKIKSAVASGEGVVVAEEAPQLTPLAYQISKSYAGISKSFDKAYFGSIKFEIEPSKLNKVEASVKNEKDVLRFLIVKTHKENNIRYHKPASAKKGERVDGAGEVSEATIDKSIDELVI